MDKLMQKRVGIYIRVSTQEQVQEGFSISAQKEKLINYCKAKDWLIYDIYIDPGHSGATLDRPEIQRLISDVEKLDIVLVYKLDRLSRSQKDTLHLIEEVFLPNNVDFVSINESFDTSTPFGRAMIGILSVFAQLEREQIKERSQMGKRERAKEGLWKGGCTPFGYDYINGKLVPNQNSEKIKLAFKMYLEGYGTPTIAKAIGQKYTSKVWAYLNSVVYAGKIKYKGEIFDGQHEALVSWEDFQKAQEIQESRRKRQERSGAKGKLLTSLVFCKRCGAKYYVHPGGSGASRHNFYYSCYSRGFSWRKNHYLVKDPNCKNDHWRMEKLDELVLERVFKLATDEKYLAETLNKTTTENDVISALKKQIQDVENKIKKLIDLFLNDEVLGDEIKNKINELYKQKKELTTSLKEEESKKKPSKTNTEAIEILSNLTKTWPMANLREKQLILGSLINKIWVDGAKVEIEWSFV